MRSITATAAALLLAACSTTDSTTTVDNTITDEAPELLDTGWPPGDLGGFYIDFNDGSSPPELSAVATESSPGFINLAQCAVNDKIPCLTTFPRDEDEYLDIDTSREIDREVVNTRFLGFSIDFAGYSLPYREDADTGFGYYVRKLQEGDPVPRGWVGASFGGQWPDYSGDNLLYVSEPVELVFPRTGGHIKFHDGERFPVEWVPTGEGKITLTISSSFGMSRMYLLEDDGYFEIDADDLGIGSLTEDLSFNFIRWNFASARKFGHVIDLVASSKAGFTGTFFQTGGRDYARAADGCAEATGLSPLQAGGYYGFLGDYNASMLIDGGCLGPGCSYGFDAMYKIEVPPRYLLQLDYNVYDDSAAMYLLTDCSNLDSCFRGSDYDPNENVHEFVNYFNPSRDLRRFYLVADSTGTADCNRGPYAAVRSYYTLDVLLDPLLEPPMYDTCADAEDAPVTFPGNYYAEFTAYVNDLNPGVGGCTSASTPGTDAMTPVELAPGQAVSVNVNMPGGDPAIYFLYQCDDEFSCPQGCDNSIDAQEICSYTNQGGATERIYIVVDSKNGILPYFLSIQ